MYYDPEIGRFISEDPLGFYAGRENHFLPEDHSLDIESVKKILTWGLILCSDGVCKF